MIQYSYLRLHGQKNFVFLGGIHVGVLVCLRKDKTRTKLFDLKTKAKHSKISYSLVNVVGEQWSLTNTCTCEGLYNIFFMYYNKS